MVVRPSDVRELNDEDKEAVKEIEKKLDAALLSNDSKTEIFISMEVIGQQKDKVINEVMRMYMNAGWDVRRDSDRDGSYLKFMERVHYSDPLD